MAEVNIITRTIYIFAEPTIKNELQWLSRSGKKCDYNSWYDEPESQEEPNKKKKTQNYGANAHKLDDRHTTKKYTRKRGGETERERELGFHNASGDP